MTSKIILGALPDFFIVIHQMKGIIILPIRINPIPGISGSQAVPALHHIIQRPHRQLPAK